MKSVNVPSKLTIANVFSTQRYLCLLMRIDKHEILYLSAAIAYTTALALAPLLLIALTLLSLLSPQWQQSLALELISFFGREVGEIIEVIVTKATEHDSFRGLSGFVSFAVLAISASAIFSLLRSSLDKINEHQSAAIDPKIPAPQLAFDLRSFLRDRLFSVGLVFAFIFLLIASLIMTTALTILFKNRMGMFWEGISVASNWLVFTVLFSAIFRFIPSARFGWMRCLQSGICATVFFLIGKHLTAIYLAKAAVGSAYGAAGSLVVLLVWLYYTSLTLLLSYEFTTTILFTDKETA